MPMMQHVVLTEVFNVKPIAILIDTRYLNVRECERDLNHDLPLISTKKVIKTCLFLEEKKCK